MVRDLRPATATAVIAAYAVQLAAEAAPGGACVLPVWITPRAGDPPPRRPMIGAGAPAEYANLQRSGES